MVFEYIHKEKILNVRAHFNLTECSKSQCTEWTSTTRKLKQYKVNGSKMHVASFQ